MSAPLPPPDPGDDTLHASLHPELSRWFRGRFGAFSPAQRAAVPAVLRGESTLLSSPTGSGKTLAAFLAVFDALRRTHDDDGEDGGIAAIYVSPLRALAYDLQKNLKEPLTELGWSWLRIAARTGDTTPAERARQKRRPPHLLVTTPESLTLLLSQPGWQSALRSTRFLIIDELHALAENKRGALLMLAAERLEELVAFTPASADPTRTQHRGLIRIGLSATVSPLPAMAEFLVGPGRPCRVLEVAQTRPARIEVFSPLSQSPYPPAGFTAARVLRELGDLIATQRTTLVFTNTRSGAESIGLRLRQLLPTMAACIEVHHASLDRAIRLEVEDRLKKGELRAVVCSTSLEMGIDIGSVDTVVMISAPKGVARALQRVGRSGHSMGETSHGVLVATNINDLAECAVTALCMEERTLEPVRFARNPLDVLAQHLVGMAVFASVTPNEAYACVRRSQPFRDLDRTDFDRVVRYLEGGGASLELNYKSIFGKLRVDEAGCLALPTPRIAREFYQNIGTIASESMVTVRLGRRNLGQVEESFMKGLRPGDIFVLNGRTVRLVETRLLTAKVTEATGALPTVPRWNANKMPLASGLAAAVVRLRSELAHLLDSGVENRPLTERHGRARQWLQERYRLSEANAAALTRHFALQTQVSVIPTDRFFLIELYAEKDLRHVFFHSLIGRGANDALSRIIAQRVQDTWGGNALVTIDDYGFLLTLKPFQAADSPEAWRPLFARHGAETALRQALADSNLVRWQFRGTAQTGLMVPRRVQGEERGARALQWSSDLIFDVLRRHEPGHPLLEEAYTEATLRFLDLPRALAFLDEVSTLPWSLRPISRVSPFSFGIFVSKIKETMTLEDPETTIERLYHDMYGRDADPARPAH